MKTKNPLVSIIITTKNEERYIGRCLDSLRRQTYRPIEIIVSDAKSTDNTMSIARRRGAKVVVKETNMPQGRNLGAQRSKGRILVFMDADTTLPANWIGDAVKDLHKENAGMVLGTFRSMERTRRARFNSWFWSDLLPYWMKVFGKTMHSTGSVFFIRRNLFFEVGGYREDRVLFEDGDLVHRISKKGKIFWDKKLVAKVSMRRFEKDGYLKWYI